jgi:hypothetical protein
MSRRRVVVPVAAVVGLLVAIGLAGHLLAGNPSGPRASSYATRPGGVAAYAELLARSGARVERLRDPLATAPLDPGSTLVVLDSPGLSHTATAHLRDFLQRGGRLVYAPSADPERTLRALTERAPPSWSPEILRASGVFLGAPGFSGVHRVTTGDRGVWTSQTASQPLAGRPDRSRLLLLEQPVGRGKLLLLANPGPLTNDGLADADNAAFGVRLAGPRRRVVFGEEIHGFAPVSGWGAIPGRFWASFALLALAAATLVAARFRRLGPPEPASRPLPPPRREYVESLARSVALARDRTQALEPLRLSARRRLATIGGVADEDDALRTTGRRLGFERDVDALLRPAHDDASALALAHAAAKIARHGQRRENE